MAKRGFFAELQHQNQLAAKRQEQAQRAQARAHAAAERQAEQARRQYERAQAQLARATVAEQKEAEREAKRLHGEARVAEVSSLNAEIASLADELDSILAATLEVDDFFDLETLRVQAAHPPFARSDLETATPRPEPLTVPAEPVLVEPEAPKGLGGVFGGKKKHAEALAAAQADFTAAHEAWKTVAAGVPTRQQRQTEKWEGDERQRNELLQQAQEEYRRECEARGVDTAAANLALDQLIAGVQSGVESAVQEYVAVVLGNSVFPELLSVEHEFAFDSELRELELTVLISRPDQLPAEKVYKYVKARDEITATMLSQKELKARYASVVHQVALRTVHEIFEADRTGHINTIALTVATEANDPATGLQKRTALTAVAAERSSFVAFDLANIVPLATLQHLGASVSKNPYDLMGIDGSPGVRGI